MSDIFREVDEALKQDKVAEFWKENGPFIIGCAIAIILATAVINAYRAWNNYHDRADTALIMEALEEQDSAAARLEEIGGELGPAHYGMALLIAAGEHLHHDRNPEAMRLFSEVAARKDVPDDFRSYASLMHASLLFEGRDSGDDKAASEKALAILKPVLADRKNPWYWHATLRAALVYAHGLQDFEKAATLVSGIAANEHVPATLRSRAMALESVYRIKQKNSQKSESR